MISDRIKSMTHAVKDSVSKTSRKLFWRSTSEPNIKTSEASHVAPKNVDDKKSSSLPGSKNEPPK